MSFKKIVLPMAVCVWLSINVFAQDAESKTDTASKATSRAPSKPKPYKEVITEKATTDPGLFIVHKVEDKYYFEIPDTLLDRDILTVNRLAKAAADNNRPANGYLGYAGDLIGQNVIQFSKGSNNKLYIKRISFSERSSDTSDNGLYRSVLNSNLQPLVASFDIKAFTPDSTGVVIDITSYINGDNDILFFHPFLKSQYYKLGPIQADKSYVSKLRSYPENVEITAVKTYGTDGNQKTYELNSSIVLLPKQKMNSRYWDPRVGYFATGYKDFDANPHRVENTYMITKWRLEPREEDIEKYKRGELVEPKKPIVYYIDPATPKKWVPYLIQGVNDWQKAFEKAGFKNAIYALEAPTNDTTWSLDDARHNAIVYKPSVVPNASGPHIHDPRTGEILETHINWYHNVMTVLHDWYMIQVGPIDPRARKMNFDDSLMGQLIRFVSSHEVGHTLGLRHNFGSSSTVPTDSLRSKRWVEANGHTPSIMDYARFNYVAQPEDNISEKGIFPRIGVYDDWAIEWGYKWLPPFNTKKAERTFFNQWIIKKLKSDKRYWFGNEFRVYPDPRRQSEDLGNDLIKSSGYGIKNLKRIITQLPDWTSEPNEDYMNLNKTYYEVFNQYQRYIYHVVSYIGGVMETPKTIEQEGSQVEFVSREKQKEALRFLYHQALKEPEWLVEQPYLLSIGVAPNFSHELFREELFYKITSNFTFLRLNKWKGLRPKEAYAVNELLNDLKELVFADLKKGKNISVSERNLQRLYVRRLTELATKARPYVQYSALIENALTGLNQLNDVPPIAKGILKSIENDIKSALKQKHDELTTLHLQDLLDRVNEYKTNKIQALNTSSSGEEGIKFRSLKDLEGYLFKVQQPINHDGWNCDMWSEISGK